MAEPEELLLCGNQTELRPYQAEGDTVFPQRQALACGHLGFCEQGHLEWEEPPQEAAGHLCGCTGQGKVANLQQEWNCRETLFKGSVCEKPRTMSISGESTRHLPGRGEASSRHAGPEP